METSPSSARPRVRALKPCASLPYSLVGARMYAFTIDEANAVLLGISTRGLQPEDSERFIASVKRVDQIASSLKTGALILNFPDPDYPSPPSLERKRIAEAKDSLRAHGSLFLLVSGSALWRSVITAVAWLSPPNAHISAEACATFADAVTRAGAYRPGCELPLVRMERALRSKLGGGTTVLNRSVAVR